jgi:hypothetical protein
MVNCPECGKTFVAKLTLESLLRNVHNMAVVTKTEFSQQRLIFFRSMLKPFMIIAGTIFVSGLMFQLGLWGFSEGYATLGFVALCFCLGGSAIMIPFSLIIGIITDN